MSPSNATRSTSVPVVVAGLPRSGTTWVAQIMGSSPEFEVCHEPDNEKLHSLAWALKAEKPRFPYLRPADPDADLRELFETAFYGRPRWFSPRLENAFRRWGSELELEVGTKSGYVYLDSPTTTDGNAVAATGHMRARPLFRGLSRMAWSRASPGTTQRRLTKSVHVPLALEWLSAQFAVEMVVVLRNPFSLYASYRRLNMPDGFRNLSLQPALQQDLGIYVPPDDFREQEGRDPIAAQLLLMLKIIQHQLQRNPRWLVLAHDQLCREPERLFREAFATLDLPWSEAVARAISASNRPGDGFSTHRVSKDQPTRWRAELPAEKVALIHDLIDRWSLTGFLDGYGLLRD